MCPIAFPDSAKLESIASVQFACFRGRLLLAVLFLGKAKQSTITDLAHFPKSHAHHAHRVWRQFRRAGPARKTIREMRAPDGMRALFLPVLCCQAQVPIPFGWANERMGWDGKHTHTKRAVLQKWFPPKRKWLILITDGVERRCKTWKSVI